MPYKIRPRHSIRPSGALKTTRATLKSIWAESSLDREDTVSCKDIIPMAANLVWLQSPFAFLSVVDTESISKLATDPSEGSFGYQGVISISREDVEDLLRRMIALANKRLDALL
ncbi:uncharacterized protein N7477_007035 [Penicillium maclennaniae]|uniref:uncharacterized protein n=1 Tax=Penicillium maclennaniae TaxID=1343394 RepID=UPI00253F9D63|nr:uncharacterized protein N7477_007035 [Penicillium maclennaniae]KAJ5668465.1 hypothetical protein N7477_007035 [Penicillium maclennaniae]